MTEPSEVGPCCSMVQDRLRDLEERATATHAELYEELHRELQDALAAAQQPAVPRP